MRTASIKRDTKETQIELALDLDGTGKGGIATGCGFLDHMLTLFARHGDFDLTVTCHGDTDVDYHHSVEDTGICLGQAFTQALGDKHFYQRIIYIHLFSINNINKKKSVKVNNLKKKLYMGCNINYN